MIEKIIPFERSFASHVKAVYWSNKNILKPEQVYLKTDKKYWFNCNLCNHEFEKKLLNIVIRNEDCPYCSCTTRNKLCDNLNCNFCFNKSFASSRYVDSFSSKNKINPQLIFKGTQKKYIFTCNICNDDFIRVMASIKNNCYCSKCQNKTEKKLLEYLINIYPNIIHQYKKNGVKMIKQIYFYHLIIV